MSGTIRHRLLVNALVDPAEAGRRLPPGVRPHVVAGGTVVGCCLLEIDAIRPAHLPAVVGRRMRAAAHRISAEWEDETGARVTGVYVPIRHTDSRLAIALGGRWFPGVHDRALVETRSSGLDLQWLVEPLEPVDLTLRVAVSVPAAAEAGGVDDPIGATCLGASVGVSPGRRGRLEAARMEPTHRDATAVTIEDLRSGFVDSFVTATRPTAYLMRDVEVTWTRASAPATTSAGLTV